LRVSSTHLFERAGSDLFWEPLCAGAEGVMSESIATRESATVESPHLRIVSAADLLC
jgi:hypothetical protein